MQASNRKRASTSGYHEAKKNKSDIDESMIDSFDEIDEYCSQVLAQQHVTSTVKSLNISNQQLATNRTHLAPVKEQQDKKFFKSRSGFPKNTPSSNYSGKKLQPSTGFNVIQRTPIRIPDTRRPTSNLSRTLNSSVKSQNEMTGFISEVSNTRCGGMESQYRPTQKNPKQQEAFKKKLESSHRRFESALTDVQKRKTEGASAGESHFDIGQFYDEKLVPLEKLIRTVPGGHKLTQTKSFSFFNSQMSRFLIK